MTCKCCTVIGGPSHARVICKGCGKEWWDYRGGSWDWEPRNCHSCTAKETLDKISKEELEHLRKLFKRNS